MTSNFSTDPDPYPATTVTVPLESIAQLLEQLGGATVTLHTAGRVAEATAADLALGAFLDTGLYAAAGAVPRWRVSAAAEVAVDAVATLLAAAVNDASFPPDAARQVRAVWDRLMVL